MTLLLTGSCLIVWSWSSGANTGIDILRTPHAVLFSSGDAFSLSLSLSLLYPHENDTSYAKLRHRNRQNKKRWKAIIGPVSPPCFQPKINKEPNQMALIELI